MNKNYPFNLSEIILSMILIFVAMGCPVGAFANEDNDSVSQQLPELVIEADKIIDKGDRVELYLSKKNREFGTNAITAISSLNRFAISLDDTSLKSYDRREVYIVINGVPSDINVLRSYQADDIKYVEYYDVTPAKYMAFTSGPVVNVITKKRFDYMTAAQLTSVNALTSLFENQYVNLTYADSLNMVKLNAQISYDNNPHNRFVSEYDYGEGNSTLFHGDRQKTRSDVQTVSLSYQRNQDNHLFDSFVRFYHRYDKENSPSDMILMENHKDFSGRRNNNSNNSQKFIDGNLYYDYSFSNKRKLAFTVLSSYSVDESRQNLISEMPAPYEQLGYDISSKYRTKEFGIAGYGSFITHILNVDLSANGKYSYLGTKLNDLEQSVETEYKKHTGEIYVDANWRKGILYLSPRIGYMISKSKFAGFDYTESSPTALFVVKLQGTKKFSPFSTQLTLGMGQTNVPISQSQEKISYIDRNFIETGNPDLKSYKNYTSELRIFYDSPKGNGWAALTASYNYSHNPFVPILYKEDDWVVKTLGAISCQRNFNLNLNGSWSPVSSVYIQPFIENKWQRIPLPDRFIKSYCFRYGGTAIWTNGTWAAQFSAYSRSLSWNGAIKSSNSMDYEGRVQWSCKSLSLALHMMHGFQNLKTEGWCEGFHYYTEVDKLRYRFRVYLIATYYISKGTTRNRNNRVLGVPSFE